MNVQTQTNSFINVYPNHILLLSLEMKHYLQQQFQLNPSAYSRLRLQSVVAQQNVVILFANVADTGVANTRGRLRTSLPSMTTSR